MLHRTKKVLTLVVLTALLWFFAYSYHDIVATSLALGCSVLLIYLAVFSTLQLYLYSAPQLELTVLGGENGKLTSQTSLTARLILAGLKVSPTFSAKVFLNWEHSGVNIKPVVFKGSVNNAQPIFSAISFPHRGVWRCERATLSFSDPFKIAVITRSVDINSSIAICPSGEASDLREVISSASKPGDISQSSTEKTGDLFEMKQYDPAQGVRTILWRVFAKRGELMSRAPEAAVTPEGFTACYALIRPEEDSLATKVIDYTARLQSSGVSIAFNCSGNTKEPVTNASKVEELLITSVWNQPSPDNSELAKLLAESRSFGEVTQIMIFFSLRGASEFMTDRFMTCLTFLEMNQIKPILAMDIPKNYHGEISAKLISLITSKNYQTLEL